jgi:hypothetical protein
MQKVINVVALLSGLVSLTVVGTTGYVYLNRDSITERAIEKVSKAATDAVTKALPGIVDKAMPEVEKLPSATGGAIPLP